MREYRTFNEVEEEYYSIHPEEIDSFLTITFEEYAKDNDMAALLSALSIIINVKNVSPTIQVPEINQQKKGKTWLNEENLGFDRVNAIMHALGYRLMPHPLATDVVNSST